MVLEVSTRTWRGRLSMSFNLSHLAKLFPIEILRRLDKRFHRSDKRLRMLPFRFLLSIHKNNDLSSMIFFQQKTLKVTQETCQIIRKPPAESDETSSNNLGNKTKEQYKMINSDTPVCQLKTNSLQCFIIVRSQHWPASRSSNNSEGVGYPVFRRKTMSRDKMDCRSLIKSEIVGHLNQEKSRKGQACSVLNHMPASCDDLNKCQSR